MVHETVGSIILYVCVYVEKKKNGRKETDGLKSETHAFINCIIFLNGDVYFVLDGPN